MAQHLLQRDLFEGKHRMAGWYRHHQLDRKSTRLNSSHGYISYAVFCLKKKKQHRSISPTRLTATQQSTRGAGEDTSSSHPTALTSTRPALSMPWSQS